ncbi:hypothetical protein AB0D13_39750, partial [Streptomyces sp. NPDC048430]|uniref:hypothetical protein n=1 Tax=Streptomyces sp. NPDC048430 TaxID=3155388 RepID=UPI00344586E9
PSRLSTSPSTAGSLPDADKNNQPSPTVYYTDPKYVRQSGCVSGAVDQFFDLFGHGGEASQVAHLLVRESGRIFVAPR